jgi:hypothetical protein
MNLDLMCLKVVQQLARRDKQNVTKLYYVEIANLWVAHHFIDEVLKVLDLVVGAWLP